jgi:RNA polymerase sigma-70 factor (ECF subfamily)
VKPQAHESESQDPLPEAEQLAAARQGSAQALGQLLELCRRYLLQIATSELASDLQHKVAASDIVQETFLEAQRIFDRFVGDSPAELRAWLRAILLNKIADGERYFRDAAKRNIDKEIAFNPDSQRQVDLPAPAGTPSLVLMAQERAAALTAAIARLPPDYRQVIIWRQVEDLTFEEIASRLGRSTDAVRKLWWRAIQQLQTQMGDLL